MAFSIPNLSPDTYVWVIRKSSDLYWEYNIQAEYEKAQLERDLGIGNVYLTDAPWWSTSTPILSYISGEDSVDVQGALADETTLATLRVAKAIGGYINSGQLTADAIISFFSDGNVLGTVANAIGYNIAKDVLSTSDEAIRELQKATLGHDGDLFKHANTPVLIKGGKTYFPKKLIDKIRNELFKANEFHLTAPKPIPLIGYKIGRASCRERV